VTAMDATFIRGVIPALVTPMGEDESIDRDGLGKLIDFVIGNGVHGLFTVGTAGESWALSPDEKRLLFEWTVELTAGRVPVYVGTAANTTREAVWLAEQAQEAGADCLSVMTPYFVTPSDPQMYDHFSAIAKSVDVPVLLYDLPARTGNGLSVDLVVSLAEDHANIVGIKDSSGDLSQSVEYLRRGPEGFRLIMGRDTLIYAALVHGAAGAIAASANVAPDLGAAIYDRYLQGDLAGALDYQTRLAPLRLAFGIGTHPAMLKAGAELMGVPVGPPRLPVQRLRPEENERLRSVLTGMGKL
jgi:4-hydroxy-tetrahydrodipicolinate synthase